MQVIVRQPKRAPDGAPIQYGRHRPEQSTLYRLVQQHAVRSIAHTEASNSAALPRFIKDEFDAFLECGIPAHAFLRLRCGECGHDKLLHAVAAPVAEPIHARRERVQFEGLVHQHGQPVDVEPEVDRLAA